MNNKESLTIMINKLRELSEIEFNSLIEIVNNIVDSNIKDEWLIEHTLDRLLNIYFIDELRLRVIYMKLINYYHRINPDASDDYLMYYFEDFKLNDEDGNLSLKKTKDE